MAKKGNYIQGRIASFGYAFQGIKTLVRSQANARIHLLASVLVLGLGLLLNLSTGEWAILALAMGGVWAAEALNTAIEFLTDLVSPDPHPLAGKAKDVAAAGVLLMAIAAAAAGLLIFIPRIILLF